MKYQNIPISFRSSLFCSFPGAFAVGNDEWNINNFPARSALENACAAAWTTGRKHASATGWAYNYNIILDKV